MVTDVASCTGNRTRSQTPEQVREAGQIARYGDEQIESLRKETYARHIEDGYTWMINAPVTARDGEKSVEERVEIYKRRGYEVIVHETAFNIRGAILPNYRAILVKSKAEERLG